MAKYSNIKLTQKGLDMAINADKSKKLIYTHIGIGDGRLAENEDILTLTAMKSRKIYADIADINNDTQNQVTLETIVSNKVVNDGFYAREIGIYAKLGDNGQEVLYGYANAGDEADYMPDKTQPIDELKLRITLIVGNVDNVTAIVNSSIIFITLADCRREIQRHNVDPTAHDNLARKDDYYTKPEVDAKLNGKANTTHGNHVPNLESANNARFLRNDNTWQTITPNNIGAYHKTEVDSRVNSKVSKSGDTMTGPLYVPRVYANDWFRATGDSGIYWQNHGGGWQMTDDTWIRVHGNKNVYCNRVIRADGGFEGKATGAAWADGAQWSRTSDRADNAGYSDNANKLQGKDLNFLYRDLGGRNQPTLTPLLIRNSSWQNDYVSGVHGQHSGDIQLRQDYRNFDAIFIVSTNTSHNCVTSYIWEKWRLEHLFNNGYKINILGSEYVCYWIWSAVKLGTKDHPISTPTLWKIEDKAEGVICEIYGLNY